MTFYSSNKQSPEVDFKTALFSGLAPDGGLYMPTTIPLFFKKELSALSTMTLPEIGSLVLQKWIDDIPSQELDAIAAKALAFPIPVNKVGEYHILELFHGPTMAFKDIAAGVLAQLFSYYLRQEKKKITILVATSGDTGGAIAQAFSGIDSVRIVILYPKGRVSDLQKEQLTRVAKNVHTFVVAGTFDDCQAMVKEAFVDPDLQSLSLSSANSINVGRLIPQIIYYVWCYAQLQNKKMTFVVPSGNLGNVTAGILAGKMGIPYKHFIIGTNENDTVVNYAATGIYKKQQTKHTLSNAMDIGNPNNFPRLTKLFNEDHKAFLNKISSYKVSDKETVAAIKKVYQDTKYLMDFHTAVAYCAAEKAHVVRKNTVLISTASPLKFAQEMKKNTRITIDDSEAVTRLQKKEKREYNLANNYKAFRKALLSIA